MKIERHLEQGGTATFSIVTLHSEGVMQLRVLVGDDGPQGTGTQRQRWSGSRP
jgi:hypothetical protein